MSFKSSNKVLSFSDLELSRKKARNNTLNHLKFLGQSIEWSRIEIETLKPCLWKIIPLRKQKRSSGLSAFNAFQNISNSFQEKTGILSTPKRCCL